MCAALTNLKHGRDKCVLLLTEGPREGQIHRWRVTVAGARHAEPRSSYLIGPGLALGLKQRCGDVSGLPDAEPVT